MLSVSSRQSRRLQLLGSRSRRMPLPPSGSGTPVSSFHQAPRSTTALQAMLAVGELPLVDDHAGVRPRRGTTSRIGRTARSRSRPPAARAEREVRPWSARRGSPPRPTRSARPSGCAGDHHRAVAVAEARSRGHQLVAVGEVGVGVEGQGGDLVRTLERRLVEGLDVPRARARCRSPSVSSSPWVRA